MSTTGDLPPWTFQLCPGCGRAVPLAMHDLTCLPFDIHTRVAVAWICHHCDLVLDLLGLFTSWDAAICAHQRELDDRARRYFNQASHADDQTISTDSRLNVTAQFRRHGTK